MTVHSNPVQLRVGVRHQPSLQHLVRTRSNSRHERTRFERSLLDIGEIIFWIAIEFHHADFNQRKLCVRPDLREIKWIPAECARLRFGHDLHTHAPLRKLSL